MQCGSSEAEFAGPGGRTVAQEVGTPPVLLFLADLTGGLRERGERPQETAVRFVFPRHRALTAPTRATQRVEAAVITGARERVRLDHLAVVGAHEASRPEQVGLAQAALETADILHLAHRNYQTLSGGERQRISLARAFLKDAPILLLDEATSALDPDTTRDVLALLRKANDELGTTVVVITHEMDVVRSLADRVAVLDAGRLVEHGTVRDIFTAPEADATRRIVGATLDIEPDAEQAEQLEAAHTGRIVTVTANPGENLGVVLGNVGRTGVGLEFVHGGVTRIKDDDLTTFTLNLTGPTDAVDGVVAELAQIATVKEVA